MVTTLTIWFYVKTGDDPKVVGDIVCAFNFAQGEHPRGSVLVDYGAWQR